MWFTFWKSPHKIPCGNPPSHHLGKGGHSQELGAVQAQGLVGFFCDDRLGLKVFGHEGVRSEEAGLSNRNGMADRRLDGEEAGFAEGHSA